MHNIIEPDIELVVTIPEPLGASLAYRTRCRTTVGVLTQLLIEAKHNIIIAAPFMQSGQGLSSSALSNALRHALQRGVDVDVLSTADSLKTIDRSYLTKDARGELRFYQAAAHFSDARQLGSHAKFCIADGVLAYVGSANLTGRGLSGQIEMGVLVRGSVARQIEIFWTYAVEVGLFINISSIAS